MNNDRLIFVTNDDGYGAKGFEAMIELASRFGHVIAIAPDGMRSGMSSAITIYNPLYLKTIRKDERVEIYALSGTPVDCVKIAFDSLLEGRKVDLALSGINHGSNSAVNVLYSGTMGAAIETAFYNIPTIGLSLLDHSADADFEAAVEYGAKIIEAVLEGNMAMPLCLNVNVPQLPMAEIKGIRVCRQTRGYWREEFFRREDPHGRPYYWLTGEFRNAEPDAEDSDEWALAHGYVSVVPVQVDMTDYKRMDEMKKMF